MRLRLLVVSASAVILGAVGCGQQTELRGLILWRGDEACVACRSAAIDLLRQAERGDPLPLVRDSKYTVEAQFELGDQPDRCIYYMFRSATWHIRPGMPTHEFLCTLLQPNVTSLGTTVGAAGEGATLRVTVSEYDAIHREFVTRHFDHEFEVVWAAR